MAEAAPPREAASVILVRPRGGAAGEVEVFLLRRHRKASFMSSAFVFPGGAADPGDADLRHTAARELFEEAGVLLAGPAAGAEAAGAGSATEATGAPAAGVPSAAELARWRAALHGGERPLAEILAGAGLAIDAAALHYFAHWITPSVEPKRFSAVFYVAALPAGQTPSFDNRETVDEVWVTPAEALARAGELKLPPPQVRTFIDLEQPAAGGMDGIMAAARERAAAPHPIMPRAAQVGTGFALLLPWDPDYLGAGFGEARAMPADHPLAAGPSRFILEEGTWKNVFAPRSASED